MELKNAWEKASGHEKKQFLLWLRSKHVNSSGTSRSTPALPPIAVNNRLEPWAAARIENLRNKLNLQVSDVMHQMGFGKLDTSLSRALIQGTRLQPGLIAALEKWLKANESI